MAKKDPRIDEYIKKAQPFAQPVLKHFRKMIHEVVPDVEETIKWGMPAFNYNGPFCGFASFKAHCSFAFWKSSLMKDAALFKSNQAEAMGDFGKVKNIGDLPNDKMFTRYLLEAKKLNDENAKVSRKSSAAPEESEMHGDFEKALRKNRSAWNFFQSSSPSFRKEYNAWIKDAKRDETRNARIESALEWIGEGKARHWKYMQKK